ncbi:MAG: hypothetical protein WB473_07410, partial [Pedococcus sp.]
MSADSLAARWVDTLAQLETVVADGERLVDQGRHEEFRALPVPVLGAALPAELADRARSLQTQITTLTALVVDAMAATMAEIELAAT